MAVCCSWESMLESYGKDYLRVEIEMVNKTVLFKLTFLFIFSNMAPGKFG